MSYTFCLTDFVDIFQILDVIIVVVVVIVVIDNLRGDAISAAEGGSDGVGGDGGCRIISAWVGGIVGVVRYVGDIVRGDVNVVCCMGITVILDR